MKFEKIINFRTPFDKRDEDPSKNYGISSLQIWFILKKGEKAVQVLISTNSYLASVQKEYKHKFPDFMESFEDYEGYTCFDVGYHSNKPSYKGQTKMECHILKSGKCYYDGSSLRGKTDEVAKNFIIHGEEWIWKYLEDEWNRMFGEGK